MVKRILLYIIRVSSHDVFVACTYVDEPTLNNGRTASGGDEPTPEVDKLVTDLVRHLKKIEEEFLKCMDEIRKMERCRIR